MGLLKDLCKKIHYNSLENKRLFSKPVHSTAHCILMMLLIGYIVIPPLALTVETSTEKVVGNCVLGTYREQFLTFLSRNLCTLFRAYVLTSLFIYLICSRHTQPRISSWDTWEIRRLYFVQRERHFYLSFGKWITMWPKQSSPTHWILSPGTMFAILGKLQSLVPLCAYHTLSSKWYGVIYCTRNYSTTGCFRSSCTSIWSSWF